MTQLQRLTALFDEMKVVYKIDTEDDGTTDVEMDEGSGYVSFFARFSFDKEGNLTKYGCWE